MPSLHPFVVLFDRIAALPITPPEKAVLWAIARHSDWTTRRGSFTSTRRVAEETGLGPSTVRRLVSNLACTALSDDRCTSYTSRCRHRGLLVLEWSDQRFAWTLELDERAVQAHLPEVAGTAPGSVDMWNAERSG